ASGARSRAGRQASRDAEAQRVGEAGFALLDALEAAAMPESLRALPLRTTLRQTWQRPYERASGAGTAPSHPARSSVRFPRNQACPPAAALASPDDPEARERQQCDTPWTGARGHVSETCADRAPPAHAGAHDHRRRL